MNATQQRCMCVRKSVRALFAMENLERRAMLSAADFDSQFTADMRQEFVAGHDDHPQSIAVQPDGKVIVLGESYTWRYKFALARYNPDGTLEESFGEDGRIITDRWYHENAADMALYDGGIVVAGWAEYEGVVALWYDRAGTLTDIATAGTGSRYVLPQWTSIAVQPDGKAIVGGSVDGHPYAARFTLDHQLDTTFGTGGFVELPQIATIADIAVGPGGKIILGGVIHTADNPAFSVIRLNADGSLDNSFDGDGIASVDLAGAAVGGAERVWAMAVQPDGKVVLAGTVAKDAGANIASGAGAIAAAVRFDENGSLDTAFAEQGIFLYDHQASTQHVSSLALQQDGKILLGGYHSDPDAGWVTTILRLDSGGNLDSSFGEEGLWSLSNAEQWWMLKDLAVAPDGRIVGLGLVTYQFEGSWQRDFSVVALEGDPLDYAWAGGPYVTPEGMLTLRGYGSTSSGHDVIYEWDLDYEGEAFDADLTGIAPTVHLNGPLTKTIAVRVRDSLGNSAIATTTLTVSNVPPTALFLHRAQVDEGEACWISIQDMSDPGGDAVTGFVVDWGDGVVRTYGVNEPVDHVYADGPAVHAIIVSAVDADGTHTLANLLVQVQNVVPSIAFPDARFAVEGTAIPVTFTTMDVGDDTVQQYIIEWGDGTSTTIAGPGRSVTVQHTYADGPSSPRLQVHLVDEDGTHRLAETATVPVLDSPPEVTASGPPLVVLGSTYSLNLTCHDLGLDTVTGWQIDWGDGQVQAVVGNPPIVTHEYTGAGSFSVTVIASNEDGVYPVPQPLGVLVRWPLETVSGSVIEDINSNGLRDPNEAGVPGALIWADLNGNGFADPGEPAALTDWRGMYTLSGLAVTAGSLTIRQLVPTGWLPATPVSTARTLSLAQGQQTAVADFYNVRSATIAGRVKNDLTGEGIADLFEPGLRNQVVFLDQNGNGRRDAGETWTRTDSAGNYRFDGLYPGLYAVGLRTPRGWRGSGRMESPQPMLLASGQTVSASPFCLTRKIVISGSVFDDANGNGRRDGREKPLVRFRVFVDRNRDGLHQRGEPLAFTSSTGDFQFLVLDAGTYDIRVNRQRGFSATMRRALNVGAGATLKVKLPMQR